MIAQQRKPIDFSDLGAQTVTPPSPDAQDDGFPQPIAPVRTSAQNAKVGDYVPINGQDMYVSGFDSTGRPSLSPGKPPTQKPDFSDLGALDFNDLGAKKVTPVSSSAPITPTNIPAGHVAMTDTNNQLQAVPFAQAQARMNTGWKVGPPSQTQFTSAQETANKQSQTTNPAPLPQSNQLQRQSWWERMGVVPSAPTGTPAYSTKVNIPERPPVPVDYSHVVSGDEAGDNLLLEGLNAGRQALAQKGGDLGAAAADKLMDLRENPEEGTKFGPKGRGIGRGTGRFVGSTVADPMTYAAGALSEAGPAAKALTSLGFAVDMGKGAVDAAGQLGEIWDRDGIPQEQKYEMATQAVLGTIAAGTSGAHGVREAFTPDNPIFANVPDEAKATLAQRINVAAKKAGISLTNVVSKAGDVAAEVGNSDMRDNLTPEAILRKSLPQAPVSDIRLALPDIKAAANDAGLKQVTTADLLDSTPDKKTGAVSPGLISEAQKAVLSEAGQEAGPGRTINDLPPAQLQPYIQRLDALDSLHDHIQQAQEKETADLSAAANTPNLPETRMQGLMRFGRGMGKAALISAAGPGIGRVSRVIMHAYGIPSSFGDMVTGIKSIVGSGGKLSPQLDDNINAALGGVQASDIPDYGATDETRNPFSPYAGDTTVKHDSLIFPPETPHGNANVLPDVPNPRFQLANSSTAQPLPRPIGQPPRLAGPPRAFTSIPPDAIPEQEPRQLEIQQQYTGPGLMARARAQSAISKPAAESAHGVGEFAVDRGQHPEEIVQNALMKLDLKSLREAVRAGDIDYSSSDTHQTLIAKIMDAYAGEDEQLAALAETLQGRRGEVKPGTRQPASPDQTDYSEIMQQSVDAANARKAQSPASQAPQNYQGPERRKNFDDRAAFEKMSTDEQVNAVFKSDKTGLPNYRAFQKITADPDMAASMPHVGYADIDNFKVANTKLGHVAVDTKVLPMIGDLFREASKNETGVVAFHRSGDEFLFRAADPAAITRVVNRVNEMLKDAEFTVQTPDGNIVTHKGVGLSHGTGIDESSAEASSDQNKSARKAGQQASKNQLQGQDLLTPRGPGLMQSAPQGRSPGLMSSLKNTQSRGPGIMTNRTVPAASLQPGDAHLVPTADLSTDPRRFQYKSGTDEQGVTNALKDQKKYDPTKGGVLLTWKDPADGKVYVVNGHHRYEMAQRTAEPSVLAMAIDAPDAETAKVIGAETNISEGHGSLVDAARFFKSANIRTPKDAMNRNLPMGQAKVTDGLAMARLDNSILDKVESGEIPEGRAAAIGRITENAAQQEATLKAIAKVENRSNRTITNGEAESIARQVKAADTHIDQGQDLFGAFNREHSLFGEQAAIDDFVLKQLRTDKRTFGAVASKSRAEALGKVKDQTINREENQRISEQAAQAEELYTKMVNGPGPLNDIRQRAAKELSNGYTKPQDVKAKAYEAVRLELQKQLGHDDDGPREGKRP